MRTNPAEVTLQHKGNQSDRLLRTDKTRLENIGLQYKGPERRRPLRSNKAEMETENTSPIRRTTRSQTLEAVLKISTYHTDEKLNRSDELADGTYFTSDSPGYGWNKELRKRSLDNSPKFQNKSSVNKTLKNDSVKSPNKRSKDVKQSSFMRTRFIFIVSIILLIFSVIGFLLTFQDEPMTNAELVKEIKKIRNEFPSQSTDVWAGFSSGIKKVSEDPSHPSVFLLLHDNEEETSICLARLVAKVATRFLNATNPTPLILDGDELGKNNTLLEDYGMLITEKQHQVEEQRSMIVYNLHKIPAGLAQSFHSFCDVETPLVAKAVYFFTLKVPGASKFKDKPTALAEKELLNLWGRQLKLDLLQPLIVRITDTVVVIKPESTLAESCHS